MLDFPSTNEYNTIASQALEMGVLLSVAACAGAALVSAVWLRRGRVCIPVGVQCRHPHNICSCKESLPLEHGVNRISIALGLRTGGRVPDAHTSIANAASE